MIANGIHTCLFTATVLFAVRGTAGQDETTTALREWFATPAAERGAFDNDVELTAAQVTTWKQQLVALQREGAKQLGLDTLPADGVKDELVVGDYTFPFVILRKGKRPANGWPVFLCLHGGGGNGNAKGPHSWNVNTREWQAQQFLTKRVYAPAGIYVIPRMADDRRGRWWHDHNQIAFDRFIEQCLLFRDADPNRVYMMGISEGGYGAIRFAGNRPDRFAGTGGMAAAEPINTSPPENMRNVAMRIDIGERDTMFDRVGLARRMGARLAELRGQDQNGYVHAVNVQQGRGHGIDYSMTPKWLAKHVRDPRPDRVVWSVRPFDSRVATDNYWLHLEAAPATMPLHLDVTLRDNVLTVIAEVERNGKRVAVDEGQLCVRLDDQLADLGKPIKIIVNGEQRPTQSPKRSLATMAQTIADRCDPNYCFCAELTIAFDSE